MASYGQACMHARQPMQMSLSRSTIASLRLWSALTGQMSTHGAASQWLQRSTVKCRLTAGNVPLSTYLTHVRNFPSGTSFSDLHATVQAWQPMHLRWSMTKPNCLPRDRVCDGGSIRRGG